jgi:hypothetical protein
MPSITSHLEAQGMTVFGRWLTSAAEMRARIGPLLRRAWDSDLRRRYVSWTRFHEKRLTWRGFLSFDRNARIRTYLYLAVAALYLSSAIGPASTGRLVRIACEAIEMAGLPRLVYSTLNYEEAMDVAALQHAFTARYDVNRNARIDASEARRLTSETGLAAGDLAISCRKGDPAKLLTAAQQQRMLPSRIANRVKHPYSMTPRALLVTLRHLNYQKGIREYESARAEMWHEAEPDLTIRWARPRDYLKWETWRRGLGRFYGSARYAAAGGVSLVTHPRALYATLREALGGRPPE